MRHCFCFLACTMMATALACGQPVDIGTLPTWLKELPPKPSWWPDVKVQFTNNVLSSNYWLHIQESENRIKHLVNEGISPIQERRELIKYINVIESSNILSLDQHKDLALRTASLYSGLGEHRRAAGTFAELAKNDPRDWVPLQGLAQECERAGQKEYALQVYVRIDNMLKNEAFYETLGPTVAGEEISRLQGKPRKCILKKPGWWEQFKKSPEWLTNSAAALPQISCFQDGVMFIRATLSRHTDHGTLVRACTALEKFPATTVWEKEEALTMLALAYDAVGDHHRAIETTWRFVDQFSFDGNECVKKLIFISKQFEKLGESENAQEIRNAIPCFEDKN